MSEHQDANLDRSFEVVTQDTVPIAEIPAGISLEQRVTALRQWLQSTEYLSPGSEYVKHLHAHVPGTGSWIYESDNFKEWVQSTDTGCLHLRGIAGSGKSVVAANTIRRLQESEPGTPVLFFFFRQIVLKNHSSKYLVRDFAAQLLPYSPLLISKIEELSKLRGVDGTEAEALWDILVQGLETAPKVYCVVDALDEMDEEDFDIVRRLVAVADRHPQSLKIIFTSRPIPKIEEALKGPRIQQTKLEASALCSDVAKYVSVSMSTLDPLLSPEVEDLVKQVICERAQGLFLHARLMTEDLAEGLKIGRINEETLPDCLETLPRSLKEVYEQILREHAKRSGVSRDQQENVLSCVIHASRPLRLIELGALIARLRGDDDLSEGKRLIRASCGPLLEILEDESVSVIHHSFTEFLCDKSRAQSVDTFPVLDPLHGHKMLATSLLQYLDGCPLLETDSDEPGGEDYDKYDDYQDKAREMERREHVLQNLQLEHPLMTYAVDYLSYHISRTREDDSELFKALDSYLVPGRSAFSIWMMRLWTSRLCRTFNIFHWAAFTGLALYMRHLIARQPASLDARDGDGRTALSYAAEIGHTEIAAALLCAGADSKSDDRLGLTPLHHASRKGNLGVAKLLLNAGVSPRIEKTKDTPYDVYHFYKHDTGKTALQDAMESGNIEVICAFLPLVHVEEANQCLHWARGHESVEAVLRTGYAAVNSFCNGNTLIFQAAASHDADALRILLKHGADPNKRCRGARRTSGGKISLEYNAPRGPTALHAFAGYAGRNTIYSTETEKVAEECLRLLLDHGGDVNATTDGDPDGYNTRDDSNLTPLHYAVQKGRDIWGWSSYDRTAELLSGMLLRAGADPNARTKQGGTPLFYVDPARPELIDLLVKYGADVDAKALSGRTPLLRLILEGNSQTKVDTELFQRLINHGADINVADENGDTIFHQIFATLDSFKLNDIPFFTTLVTAGVDMNRRNAKGVLPLFMYRGKPVDEGLLRFFIENGLDVNARNNKGETVLWRIVDQYYAKPESLALFIRLGVDVTVRANDGTTLLHLAVRKERSVEWLPLIASAGVDPLTTGAEGDSLAHLVIQTSAFQPKFLELIRLLAELGVPITAPNHRGQTPLHTASAARPNYDHCSRSSEEWIDAVMTNPIFGYPDVNVRDTHGATPLHMAASVSEFTVGKLLRAGADLTILTREGISPLHIASGALQPGIVRVLLASYKQLGIIDQFIDLKDEKEASGRTALHYACRSGCQDSVRALLAYGASPASRDVMGLTPLHALAEFPQEDDLWGFRMPGLCQPASRRHDNRPWDSFRDGIFEIIDLLHGAGADLSAVASDQNGSPITPADVAIRSNFTQFLRELSRVAGGVSKLPPTTAAEQEELNGAVQALLDISDKIDIPEKIADEVENGRYEVIKEYVRLGGDLFALDRCNDSTSLHKLVTLGQAKLLECFITEASRVDDEVNRQMQSWEEEESEDEDEHDSGGPGTLLGAACDRGHPNLEVVRVLVERVGLDINGLSHLRGFCYKLKKATPLHIVACGAHFWNIEALEYLLEHGADLEALNLSGETPLLVAISSEHPSGFWKEETIQVLLRQGADPNTISPESGLSALAMSDHASVTRLLLEHGADITRAHDALHHAVAKLDIEMMELLLKAGAHPNFVQDIDSDGTGKPDTRFPIHNAATQYNRGESENKLPNWVTRQQSAVALLIEYGADYFAAYGDGSHALQCIIEQHGLIRPMLASKDFDSERRGKGGRTPLLSACMPRALIPKRPGFKQPEPPTVAHVDAALSLLERGALVHVTDDLGRTPLHWLCTMTQTFDDGHMEVVRKLVTRDSSLIHVKDNEGFKPIHISLGSGADWVTQYFLDHGASPIEPDPDGNIALHHVASRLVGERVGALAAAVIFRKFLSLGLDINTRNKRGETPIFVFMSTGWSGTPDPAGKICHPSYAIENDVFHCEALPLFIEANADLFTAADGGATLLHAAAQRHIEAPRSNLDQVKDATEIYERLLQLGLDPKKEDDRMRTSIDIAVATSKRDIVNLFTDDGKKLRERRKRRETEGAK